RLAIQPSSPSVTPATMNTIRAPSYDRSCSSRIITGVAAIRASVRILGICDNTAGKGGIQEMGRREPPGPGLRAAESFTAHPPGASITIARRGRDYTTFLRTVHQSAMPEKPLPPMTYKEAGVDIDAGDALVERIKPLAASTMRPECLGGLGGFGGLFQLAAHRYREPVLVAGTDGVGTKLKLTIELDRHDSIGIDLVALCVNDIGVCGAEPLFFLDYFATARLSPAHGEAVVGGIAEGCRQAGAALIGGETAEMPGMYAAGDYDLAGFAVGVVEKDRIIDGS